jgi:peptidoglycan/xylan/chitin deacetylase (PgdA/CDA1 family)
MIAGVKRGLKTGLRQGIGMLPLSVLRRWQPRALTAIFYHAVSPEPLPHVAHLYPPLTPAQFEAALQYLQRHFHPVSYDQIHDWYAGRAELPPRAVHLSFDDGFGECYRVVVPLLLQYGIPSTFFVTTDWIDNRAMFFRHKVSLCIDALRHLERDALAMVLGSLSNALGWPLRNKAGLESWLRSLGRDNTPLVDMAGKMLGLDFASFVQDRRVYLASDEIREMAAQGFTIGSHSISHPKMNALSADEMEVEVLGSVRFVRELTGADVVPFSFPHSAFGIDRGLLAGIRERNPALGLLFDTKGMQPDVPFIVQRIWAEKAAYAHSGRRTNLPRLLKGAYADVVVGS